MADKPASRELGDLFYWSIPELLEVPAAGLHELAHHAGLPPSWLPKPATRLFAFKRAAMQLGAQRVKRILGGGGNRRLVQTTVYLRDAPRQHNLRHVVKEIQRGSDKPEYVILGTIEFRDGLHFACTATDPGEAREFDAMQAAFEQRFQACQGVYAGKDLQRLMNRGMRHMQALPLRPSGGVFFIPFSHRILLRSLMHFVEALGGESDAFSIHNTPLEAERLARKLQQTLVHERRALETRLEEMQLQGTIPACRIRGFHASLEWCRNLSKTYASILAADLAPVQHALQRTEALVQAIEAT